MATTGIWPIKKRLDVVIDYVANLEKTERDADYSELHNFGEYEDFDYNSEENCYVSGINCLPDSAYKDMMFTKTEYDKKSGTLGYHAFQSFKEGEVTAELAHKIGIKLAQEMWGDRFEVVVATHQNTNHIHNHFVINSVSFKDGKKYHGCNENYAIFRKLSDSLCEEYGLSVLPEKKDSKINYNNFYNNYVKKNNYHTIAKEDLDRAIGMAYSYKDFELILNKMGYEINNRAGKLSIRREPFKKNIRIERAFGEEYSISRIEVRIEEEHLTRVPFIESISKLEKVKSFKEHQRDKRKGIYGIFRYYCYILGVYPKQYPKRILTPALRLEVQKMNEISKQTELLVDKKIKTYEQLLLYKDKQKDGVREMSSKRHNLWIKHNRTSKVDEKEKIRQEIDVITKELNKYKEEVKLCEGIEKRMGIVKENIKEFEEERRKEKIKDEQ